MKKNWGPLLLFGLVLSHFRGMRSTTYRGFSCCFMFSGSRAAAQGGVSGTRGGGQMAGRAVPGDGGSPGLGE